MENIWGTTMTLFMTNAKDSFGPDASEMETDFLTLSAATPPVLASMVSTHISLLLSLLHVNISICYWILINESVLILKKTRSAITCFLFVFCLKLMVMRQRRMSQTLQLVSRHTLTLKDIMWEKQIVLTIMSQLLTSFLLSTISIYTNLIVKLPPSLTAIICGVLLALIAVAIIGTVVFLTLKSK